MRPLTNEEIRKIEKLRVIAGKWPETEARISFYDDEGDCVWDMEFSPELLKSICDFALALNENFTKAWRGSYGGRSV